MEYSREKKVGNRSSRRSRAAIRKAFAELMEEKQDLNKITVVELVNRADISKSTFYAHYLDIYDVIEEFSSEIIDEINNSIDEFMKNSNEESTEFMPYISNLLNLLKENEDLYKKLFVLDRQINFIDKIKKMMIEKITTDIKIKFGIKNKDLLLTIVDFLTNGIVYLVCDYFKGRINMTLDEIASLINTLLKELATKTKDIKNVE